MNKSRAFCVILLFICNINLYRCGLSSSTRSKSDNSKILQVTDSRFVGKYESQLLTKLLTSTTSIGIIEDFPAFIDSLHAFNNSYVFIISALKYNSSATKEEIMKQPNMILLNNAIAKLFNHYLTYFVPVFEINPIYFPQFCCIFFIHFILFEIHLKTIAIYHHWY